MISSDCDEKKKQSPHSPGAVEDSEKLLRIMFFPDHVDENNRLKPESISRADLGERGFSVQRKGYADKKKILEIISGYESRKSEGRCVGVSPSLCENIRKLRDQDGLQAFKVFDDAQDKADPSHAIILAARGYTRSRLRGIRNKLKDEFGVILDIDNALS